MKLRIDLASSTQGNIMYLMGVASRFVQDLLKHKSFVLTEMSEAGNDYKQVIRIFKKHFGGFVILINDPTIHERIQ